MHETVPLHRAMPALLRELNQLEYDYADGDGMDFEPYTEFLSAEETRTWIQAWTGNSSLEGQEYLVFGQDGTGGLAAFWCTRPGAPILEQPIVFFGSEGELGVLACHFADYLWLLAGGFGPYEGLAYPDSERRPHSAFTAFAAEHAGMAKKSPSAVLMNARAEFPRFVEDIQSLCG